jgi:hypothetical protein
VSSTHPLCLREQAWPAIRTAWFYESLYTALTHPEPAIAFRCVLQAMAYMPEQPSARDCDWVRAAQGRIDDHLATTKEFKP